MLASSLNHQFLRLNHVTIDQDIHYKNSINRFCRRQYTIRVIRGCLNKPRQNKTYYQVLGVPFHSSAQEIKDAYRRLQKRHHPDIAGEKGHESTLMLNKAYEVLMREESRKEYDASIGKTSVYLGRDFVGSKWEGPLKPQALFVDENSCIGCRECVSHARNTFAIDEAFGTARVQVQFGDDEDKIQTSVDSCPVNCIHWVDTEELQVLEYLIQPQPKIGHGVFGQGWERPSNVFLAAKSFNKKLKQQDVKQKKYARSSNEEDTRAQAQAREAAYMGLKIGSFVRIWTRMKERIGL